MRPVTPIAASSTSLTLVAVLPFNVVGQSQDASSFATSIRDEIIGALSTHQIDTLSRFGEPTSQGRDPNALARMGVGYVVDGLVRSDGANLTVRLHLDDAQTHTTLWSTQHSAPVREADSLQARVAADAAQVVGWVVSPSANPVRRRPDVLAAYLSSGRSSSVAVSQRIVAEAPSFAGGHVLNAENLERSALGLSVEEQDQAAPKIAAEARLAIKLEPTNGWAHAVLAVATPFSAWRERENILLEGVERDPNEGTVRDHYNVFLRQVGRINGAVEQGRLAAQPDPYFLAAQAELAISLAVAGRKEEALAAMADAKRLAPEEAGFVVIEVRILSYNNDSSSRMLELWKDPTWRQTVDNPEVYDLWQTVIEAIIGKDHAKKAAAARTLLTAATKYGSRIGSDVSLSLTRLGDIDGAFVVAGNQAAENSRHPVFFNRIDTT